VFECSGGARTDEEKWDVGGVSMHRHDAVPATPLSHVRYGPRPEALRLPLAEDLPFKSRLVNTNSTHRGNVGSYRRLKTETLGELLTRNETLPARREECPASNTTRENPDFATLRQTAVHAGDFAALCFIARLGRFSLTSAKRA